MPASRRPRGRPPGRWGSPAFAVVARHRPVALVQPGTDLPHAPYVAVESDLAPAGRHRSRIALTSGPTRLEATWDGTTVALAVRTGDRVTRHVSRRHGRGRTPSALALTLTGDVVTAFVREEGDWVARSRVDLATPDLAGARAAGLDVHDEGWLAGLAVDGDVDRSGTFGQLGLRDLRLVTEADGTAYAGDAPGEVLLTATSAGPGGFASGHTSVWSLDTRSHELRHRGDLFFRRPDRPGVHGDHASHLLRADGEWLVATSTWGDFHRERHPHVGTTLATSTADLLTGAHVLDTRPLDLPTTGLTSVGTWDPHLVRTGSGWLVAYVSASRWFRFHPVVATGPDLDALTLRAAAVGQVACEGPTLLPLDGSWRVLASCGPDSARRDRATYPVLDLDLRPLGTLDAAHLGNIPWPTLAPVDGGWLMVGFDGTTAGGRLLPYGTHGDVLVHHAEGTFTF